MARPEAGGGRSAPTLKQDPRVKTFTWNGTLITRGIDGIFILPGGERLPAGSTLNAAKKTIDLPNGKHISFRSGGRILLNTPIPKRDRLAKQTYTQEPYGGATQAAKPAAAPARSGDSNRQPMGAARPAVAAPPAGDREGVRALQRELNARGANLVVDGLMGPKTRAAQARFGGATAAAPAPSGGVGGSAAPAGTVTGGGGVSMPGAPATISTSGPEVDAEVRRMFGDVAGFLGDPELGPILRKAAQEGWDSTRLFGALQQTNFWRTKADDERKFFMLSQLDPATARVMVDARAADIRALSEQLGVRMTDDRMRQVAAASVRLGWNQNQIREAATSGFQYVGGESGAAGQAAREVKEMAAQYLVPLSQQALGKWVEQMVQGTVDSEGFRSYLVEQAKSMFPGMAAALDKGVTVAQYADPYRQVVARELEISPDQVDLNEPRFRKMLDKVDEKGNRTAMTLSESTQYARTLPEWQQTRGANEKAAALTESLLVKFGAKAG